MLLLPQMNGVIALLTLDVAGIGYIALPSGSDNYPEAWNIISRFRLIEDQHRNAMQRRTASSITINGAIQPLSILMKFFALSQHFHNDVYALLAGLRFFRGL